MSNLGTGNPYVILPQTSVGVVPIVGVETQVGNNRIVSYVLVAGPVAPNTLDGAWKIEASNDFARDADVSMGNRQNTGTWVDITAMFKQPDGTAVAAVAHGTAASQKQYVQAAPVGARVTRVTFTPSAGVSTVSAAVAGGSY